MRSVPAGHDVHASHTRLAVNNGTDTWYCEPTVHWLMAEQARSLVSVASVEMYAVTKLHDRTAVHDSALLTNENVDPSSHDVHRRSLETVGTLNT